MSETTTETYKLYFCIDCGMLHANGEVPADWSDVAVADWLGYIGANLEGLHVAVGESEDHTDQSFSWSSCDSCGSMLGGFRYAATAWEV